MVRPQISRNARTAPALFIAAIFFSLSLAGAAQPSTNMAQPNSNAAQPSTNSAPPAIAAPTQRAISGLLQPSLDAVHQTLQSLRLDKWKKGTVRDEASTNIDSIQNDLRSNLPPLLQVADAASGTVSKLLPVSSHVDALYDVLLRVTEAARVAGPDDQAAQLQHALLSLGTARLALNDRIQGSAGALEKQVVDLRASIQAEAARRAATPVPVALPCVPPPARKTTTRKPAAKPAASTKPATTATPGTSKGTQSAPSH
jgi:hypothetical protein